jgi:hypothetical protein
MSETQERMRQVAELNGKDFRQYVRFEVAFRALDR